MGAIIIGGKQEDPATLVSEETDDQYKAPRPISPIFENVLMAVVHGSDEYKKMGIYMDLGLTKEKAKAQRDVGVFSAVFKGWKCSVNWTTKPQGGMPPGHALVEFGTTKVATLSPFTDGLPVSGYPAVNEWYAHTIGPSYLMRDCAELIADKTKKPQMWKHFKGDEADDEIAGITQTEIEEMSL